MNFKTTLYLAVVLACLGIMVLWWPQQEPSDSGISEERQFGASPIARDLIEPPFGDIVKITCRRMGTDEWVFEKVSEAEDSDEKTWHMTSPLEMKAVRWEVDRIGRSLGGLSYEVSYRPGEPGAITAEEAGLAPPQTVVTLTDAEGETATIEIGKPASSDRTYVRLAGSDEICVGMSSLDTLIKQKAFEYRDQQLWSFEPADVTRLEIVDRSAPADPVSYAFSRDGARWLMESPVSAKATTKVDDLLRTMRGLRVVKWHNDQSERLAAYGFDPAVLTVRVTVEEEIAAGQDSAKDDAEAGEAGEEQEADRQPEKKTTVYVLHVSGRSPIGEETKVYVRAGDEPTVATVMKSTADKLKPVMSEWREMRITTANVTAATRMMVSTPAGSAELVSKDGAWSFSADDSPAEDQAVRDALKAISGLSAVGFLDGEPIDLAEFGLDTPQADIRLTIPGLEEVERIAVGGYTDKKTKRLVYVRRNEVASVAKVRASDVVALIRGPRAYRYRTIVDIPSKRFEQVTLTSPKKCGGGLNVVTFSREKDAWSISAPIPASVREDRLGELIDAFGGLRAESIAADAGEPSEFGLHSPGARVVLTHKPPVEYRLEPGVEEKAGDTDTADDAGEPGESAESTDGPSGTSQEKEPQRLVPVEVQPPSETIEMIFAEHDGSFYAKRADRTAIYEISEALYTQLLEEYRSDTVLDFDDTEVRRLSIRQGDEVHVFNRVDDNWKYQDEPDLPLDSKKVTDLLLRVKDLKTERYADHAAEVGAEFGLGDPLHEVVVTLDDETTVTLLVSNRRCTETPSSGYYAAVKGRPGVFLLTTPTLQRFAVSLEELETKP